MKRRDVLKTMGAVAGAGVTSKFLGACSSDSPEADGSPDAAPRPVGITTIVTLCMENRSYDHYFGARALEGLGGNGLAMAMSNPNLNDELISVFHDTSTCIPDPPHGWESSRLQIADGNLGFLKEYEHEIGGGGPAYPMGYFKRDEIPVLWSLADNFASCDAWYSSVLGPTWPNRMYMHSGQSGGLTSNERPPGGFPWRSIQHQLNDANIPWRYYFQDLPFVPLFKDLDTDGFVKRINHFFQEAKDGTLPPAVWIEPNFGFNDDHPPHHPLAGQQLIASIYRALAESPQWENCLFVVTYDEHGGFYDHVTPPTAPDERSAEGFGQLGVRVPTVIAGPYVKPGHISTLTYDHTSVLKHIGNMHGLEPLTERITWAPDLSDVLDMERLQNGNPRPPEEIPVVEIDEGVITDACFISERLSQPELEFEVEGGLLTRFDGRKHRVDDAYFIGDVLDSMNGGRIRRGR